MIISKKNLLLLLTCSLFSLSAKQSIIEFKSAYFLSTNSHFKDIFGKGGALYGPELTLQLYDNEPWYFFASFDYLHNKGHSLGFCDKTSVRLIPLSLGLKYFAATSNKNVDLYIGLGFVAENVRTKNCSSFVLSHTSQWGFGGVAKIGTYYTMPHNLVLDLFIDYNFVRVGNNHWNCAENPQVQSLHANVSGALFGAGLGYKF